MRACLSNSKFRPTTPSSTTPLRPSPIVPPSSCSGPPRANLTWPAPMSSGADCCGCSVHAEQRRVRSSLRGTVTRIEYAFTGSRLEAQFLLWELARQHLGSDYRREIRLRLPPYVQQVLSNRFPRTHITTRIGRAPAVYFGPFRNRLHGGAFLIRNFSISSSSAAARTISRPVPPTPAACMARWDAASVRATKP